MKFKIKCGISFVRYVDLNGFCEAITFCKKLYQSILQNWKNNMHLLRLSEFFRLAAASSLEAELKKTISDLQAQITTLSSAQKESASSLGGKLKSHEAELSTATVELTTLRSELTKLKAELETVQKNCQLAEEKYAHEMVLHAKDLEVIFAVFIDRTYLHSYILLKVCWLA